MGIMLILKDVENKINIFELMCYGKAPYVSKETLKHTGYTKCQRN